MKQYVKNKTIKWGFKFWFRCASPTGYLYQLDLYLSKKGKKTEENFGPSVVLKMTECLENSHCTVFFNDFFNGPSLIPKPYDRGFRFRYFADFNSKIVLLGQKGFE